MKTKTLILINFFLCLNTVDNLALSISAYSTINTLPEDQATLKWLSKQYKKTRSFYKLQNVQTNKDFYIDLVQERLDYLMNKTKSTKFVVPSKSSNRLFILIIATGLVTLLSQKIEPGEYTIAKIMAVLCAPIYVYSVAKLCTYSKRLHKRIIRYQDILERLQDGIK
ncbi:hypothetical protein Noda2021_06870 [Candidatus Dependentiae bacterium Noda2021]|nr:hypothetical protein Noda2021_06870 [Candidatus Dependentiae bacterium Noda2021]